MPGITDDDMRAMLATTKQYAVVLLRSGPKRGGPDDNAIIWEHGRRNLELRAQGKLAIVCPTGDPALAGIGIFAAGPEEVRRIMDEDPGVQAGIFTYEVYPCRSFPGDALP